MFTNPKAFCPYHKPFLIIAIKKTKNGAKKYRMPHFLVSESMGDDKKRRSRSRDRKRSRSKSRSREKKKVSAFFIIILLLYLPIL